MPSPGRRRIATPASAAPIEPASQGPAPAPREYLSVRCPNCEARGQAQEVMTVTSAPGALVGIGNRPDSAHDNVGAWCPRCRALVIVHIVRLTT